MKNKNKNHKRKSNKPEQFFQFHLPSGGTKITAKLLSDDEEKRRDKYGYYNINI